MTRAMLAALAILTAAAPAAAAGGVTGIWMRDDGTAKIRFAPCGGEAVCGFLAWKKNPGGPAKIGQELFFDMKPNGPELVGRIRVQPRGRQTLQRQDDALRRPSRHRRLRARRAHLQVVRLDARAVAHARRRECAELAASR